MRPIVGVLCLGVLASSGCTRRVIEQEPPAASPRNAVGCAEQPRSYPDARTSDCVAPDGRGTRGVTVDGIAVSAGPLRAAGSQSCLPVGLINALPSAVAVGPANFRLMTRTGTPVPFNVVGLTGPSLAPSKTTSGFLCWPSSRAASTLVFAAAPFAPTRAVFPIS